MWYNDESLRTHSSAIAGEKAHTQVPVHLQIYKLSDKGLSLFYALQMLLAGDTVSMDNYHARALGVSNLRGLNAKLQARSQTWRRSGVPVGQTEMLGSLSYTISS